MERSRETITRRQFMQKTAKGAGVLGLAGAAVSFNHVANEAAAADKPANPFVYDVDRLAKTDPKLICYEQVDRIGSVGSSPRRIAIGPEDRLHVAAQDGIAIFGSDGALRGTIALPFPARCVAVAHDGTIYAGLKDQVQVFNPRSEQQGTWQVPGKKTWLTGLTVGENDVFVANSGDRVVLRFDRSGKLVGRLGEKNKDRGVPGLIVPSPYLVVDLGRDGLLRVNNPGRHCVEVYTANGDLELSWGKPSGAIGGFCGCCNPIGLAMLPDGHCLTCEKGLPRVKVYASDGTFECVVAGTEVFPENAKTGSVHDLSDGSMGGLDVAVDSAGRIYILDLVAGDVRIMRRKT